METIKRENEKEIPEAENKKQEQDSAPAPEGNYQQFTEGFRQNAGNNSVASEMSPGNGSDYR